MSTLKRRGSGMTAKMIVDDLRKARVSQFKRTMDDLGKPPRTVAILVAAFEEGFNVVLRDFDAMGIVTTYKDAAEFKAASEQEAGGGK